MIHLGHADATNTPSMAVTGSVHAQSGVPFTVQTEIHLGLSRLIEGPREAVCPKRLVSWHGADRGPAFILGELGIECREVHSNSASLFADADVPLRPPPEIVAGLAVPPLHLRSLLSGHSMSPARSNINFFLPKLKF
jgi:hypothetical protein